MYVRGDMQPLHICSTWLYLVSAFEWSTEQWLWPRGSPWNCCSGCLFLAGEGAVCVGSERSVQWVPTEWILFCFAFLPAWRWWIECQLSPGQLPDITVAVILGLTLYSSDWAGKGMFWTAGTGTSLNCRAAATGIPPVGLSSNSGIKDSLELPGGSTDSKVYGNELTVIGKGIWK